MISALINIALISAKSRPSPHRHNPDRPRAEIKLSAQFEVYAIVWVNSYLHWLVASDVTHFLTSSHQRWREATACCQPMATPR
jgi:hypothetical protein